MNKLPGFLLWMLIIITTPGAFAQENILLITYGADSRTIEGDNDHQQEIIIRIPETVKDNLYVRIFDPDVGGVLDDKFGFHKGFDTKTRFTLYGAGQIKSEIFAADKTKDNSWHTFARFSPKEGDLKDGHYFFKLRIEGLEGDDGNVFDVAVSEFPDKNRKPGGAEIINYEPTIRLPKEGVSAEMRFFVPEDASELTVRGFDMAEAKVRVTTPFRSGLRVRASGQDEWADSKIELTEIENQRMFGLTFTGGREIPNDATFTISTQNGENLPVQLPIPVPQKNHRPVPHIRVTYLSDCYSVRFDASGSRDKDGDRLSYSWDFGDGTTDKGVRVTHRYDEQSAFEVTLVVTDDSGQVGNAASETAKIYINQPPRAKAGSPQAVSGQINAAPEQEITFDGSASEDPDGEIRYYFWMFGDSKTRFGKKVTHAFKKPGNYKVSLRVGDKSQRPCNKDTDTLNVLINARPFVNIGKNRIGAVGEILHFDAEKVYDSDGEIIKYLWEFGDDTQKEGKTVTHTYAEPGNYTVILTVEDDSGTLNSVASDKIVMVTNDPPVAEFEIRNLKLETRNRGTAGEIMTFDASTSFDRDGKIISYSWDFGDNNTSVGKKVTHAYQQPGTYHVTLTVEDDSKTSSSEHSETLPVIINDPPVAKFETRNSELETGNRGAAGEVMTFDASESFDRDGELIAYLWDFGDNSEGTGVTVTHAYQQPGTYHVRLTVEDDSETSSSQHSHSLILIVNHPPKADAGPDQLVSASAVQFDATGSQDPDGEIISYHWEFGDGSAAPDAGPSPVHVYGTPGDYTVRLTVSDDSETLSSQNSDHMKVIVNHKPIADAGPDQTGVPGQPVHFDGSASFDPDGHIRGFQWNFGNGSVSEISKKPMISHTYTTPGIYNAQLTVQDNTGHKEATDTDDLVIVINAPPVAKISSQFPILNSQLTAAPGQRITFDGKRSYDPDGEVAEYRWDFSSSDAELIETLMGPEVSKEYPDPGIYSVVLTVNDDSIAENARSQDKMLIHINHSPEASTGKNIVTCDRTIHFDGYNSADADGDPLNYSWDFGDGTPHQSGGRVIHTYKESGTYPVILTVDDGRNLENSRNVAAFTVSINQAPVADAGEDQMVCGGDVVLFSGGRSYDPEGGLLKYHWDFDDNTTAEGLNPTKVFKKGGTYQVTLTIEDDSGLECNRSSDQMVVRVTDAPIADAGKDLTVCANTEVHFDGSGSWDTDGEVNSFLWDFGDGATGGGSKPSHIYTEPGIYPVKLSITGDSTGLCDNTDTAEITVTVHESPHAVISAPFLVPVHKSVEFDGSASESNEGKIVSWKWDFGDGHSGKNVKTAHSYHKPGRYPVRLTITTDPENICNTVTAHHMIVVNGPPVANADADNFVGVNEVVVFNGSGSSDKDGAIIRYEWDFGDGETADGVEVRHRYQAGGRYLVTLKVTDDTDAENNWDTDNIRVAVNNTPQAVIETGNSELETGNSDFWACPGEKIRFSAENSSDPDGDILKSKTSHYYWDFGDGQNAEGLRVSHTYETWGKYLVTLIADDGSGVGNSQDEANERIIVNHPPMADGGPDRIVCPRETISFDGSNSTDPDSKSLTYHWDFGDGNTAQGAEATHVFEKPGSYKAYLTVTDDSGTACGTSKDMILVKVNAAPVADAGPDKEAFVGGAHDAVLFDATGSYDPDGDPLACYWDFGDGTHETGVRVFHTYVQPGTYTVRVRVRDSVKTSCSEVRDQLTVTVRQRENVQ
ncbi:PKD domain-containing protein [Desulfonema magnum]|uniref:PKD domain-containing protein n=1 Tax=Desulfonema magnum TaxID=45655 RepID=A0A975GRP3_9BACT|nr:PKD domain-containing protein [Desulfonema magnum]QTA90208.1 PKD domain-containing protein [Desulfonema magnum]